MYTKTKDEIIAELENENKRLRGMIVWGFYENEYPEFSQGNEQLCELHEVVTAKQVQYTNEAMIYYRKESERLLTQVSKLLKQIDEINEK